MFEPEWDTLKPSIISLADPQCHEAREMQLQRAGEFGPDSQPLISPVLAQQCLLPLCKQSQELTRQTRLLGSGGYSSFRLVVPGRTAVEAGGRTRLGSTSRHWDQDPHATS